MTGLKYGTYYLEETKAPEKYVPLTNRVAFTIDEQSYVTAGQLISPEKYQINTKVHFLQQAVRESMCISVQE